MEALEESVRGAGGFGSTGVGMAGSRGAESSTTAAAATGHEIPGDSGTGGAA